jgi:hypothetical protein
MLGLCDELAHHGLDHSHVAIQKTAQRPGQQRQPKVLGKAKQHHTQHRTGESQEKHGLAADPIGQRPPKTSSQGFCKGKGRHKNAGEEGYILLGKDMKSLNHRKGYGEYRGQRHRLRQAAYC